MGKNCCDSCGAEKEKVVCIKHQYFVSLQKFLTSIRHSVWTLEVNELSLGKSDDLRVIMNQLQQTIESMDKIVKDPDYYGIENLLNKQ